MVPPPAEAAPVAAAFGEVGRRLAGGRCCLLPAACWSRHSRGPRVGGADSTPTSLPLRQRVAPKPDTDQPWLGAQRPARPASQSGTLTLVRNTSTAAPFPQKPPNRTPPPNPPTKDPGKKPQHPDSGAPGPRPRGRHRCAPRARRPPGDQGVGRGGVVAPGGACRAAGDHTGCGGPAGGGGLKAGWRWGARRLRAYAARGCGFSGFPFALRASQTLNPKAKRPTQTDCPQSLSFGRPGRTIWPSSPRRQRPPRARAPGARQMRRRRRPRRRRSCPRT